MRSPPSSLSHLPTTGSSRRCLDAIRRLWTSPNFANVEILCSPRVVILGILLQSLFFVNQRFGPSVPPVESEAATWSEFFQQQTTLWSQLLHHTAFWTYQGLLIACLPSRMAKWLDRDDDTTDWNTIPNSFSSRTRIQRIQDGLVGQDLVVKSCCCAIIEECWRTIRNCKKIH